MITVPSLWHHADDVSNRSYHAAMDESNILIGSTTQSSPVVMIRGGRIVVHEVIYVGT
jgi:hypothetical protein